MLLLQSMGRQSRAIFSLYAQYGDLRLRAMPKRKKKIVAKKRKGDEVVDEDAESDSPKKVAAASSTSQCGDEGEEVSSFTSVPLLRASEEGLKGSMTSHFMCNYCEFSAESKADLVSHMRKHMIKCTKCTFSSLSRREVTQHCKEEHDVDFEVKTHEVATSSTEVEMDKDPCSACVFCKFMTYSTEHLERHTSLKHPGMLPKSVAKMVTKLASTKIRQGDVRFYLSLSGKDSSEGSKVVSSSPPKEESSEPIEIEDEVPADIKPKFEPLEQKVSPGILNKQKPVTSDLKSAADLHALETFTQQLAKRMKVENMSVRSEADTSESDRKPERGVKVETIYCLTCPFSNVLIDKLKCHTLVQHPLGAAVATYSASESSLSDFTFFCVKEECPYSTGDLNEYQRHLMHCCSAIKSLKIVERERFKSTVSFIFELQKKHSLDVEEGFGEFASPALPQSHPVAKVTKEPPVRDNQPQQAPLMSARSDVTVISKPPTETQSSVQQAMPAGIQNLNEGIQNPIEPDIRLHQRVQAVPNAQNQVSAQLHTLNNSHQQSSDIFPSAYQPNGSTFQSGGLSALSPQSSLYRQQKPHQHQPLTSTGQFTNAYNSGTSHAITANGGQIQNQQESTNLPNFLGAGSVSSANEQDQLTFQENSQTAAWRNGQMPLSTSGQQVLQLPSNNATTYQHQGARGRGRIVQGQVGYQRGIPSGPMLPQQQLPVQGLPRPRMPLLKPVRRGQGTFMGRGRPPGISAPVQNTASDDDVIVTAVVRMSPSSQRGRPPGAARGRAPTMSPQRLRAPASSYGQMQNLPRGRGTPVRPTFTPVSQPRPIDMRSHFEALACAADPNEEEDDLQIVGMTPGKDRSFGNPKAVDASRFSYCCLHCGKDQGSKDVMKQHMKACHNDTLLGAFTNIDTGQWLYFCPQLNCAFMTYNEERLRDHLQKCCDPEKWKAFDFGVAMNNLKSMKIRQMEVRSISGSQNDLVDLDGRGMRDRFSTSLNDAFDDIVVNTTGRQMVRPMRGRRPQAALNVRDQLQRMPHPYQPMNPVVRGRSSMFRPRQSTERVLRGLSARVRLPMPRAPGMNSSAPGFPMPANRRPGFSPSQPAGRMVSPMQRPRMPHPHPAPERPRPTTLQNPILIDVDPDSPEEARDNSSNKVDCERFTGQSQPQFSSPSPNVAYNGNSSFTGMQSQFEIQPAAGSEGLFSGNQNTDQLSSNFLSVPSNEISDTDHSVQPNTVTPEDSVALNSFSSIEKSAERSALSTDQLAAPINDVTEGELMPVHPPDQENLNRKQSATTSATTFVSVTDNTTVTLGSNMSSTKETHENFGISNDSETLNPEPLTQDLPESSVNHQGNALPDCHNTDTFTDELGSLESRFVPPEISQVSSVSSNFEMLDSQLRHFPENCGQHFEPMTGLPSPSLSSAHPLPRNDMQYAVALIETNTAPSYETPPLCSVEKQNPAVNLQSSLPGVESSVFSHARAASSISTSGCVLQSKTQASYQFESTSDKEVEPAAKTDSLFSGEPLPVPSMPSSPSSGWPAAFTADMQGESSFDQHQEPSSKASTNKQSVTSTKMHHSSSFDNLCTPASSSDVQSLSSKDLQTAFCGNMQFTPSTSMQSSIPSSQMQSKTSSDTQPMTLADVQTVISSSEMQGVPSVDQQYIAPSTQMLYSVPTSEMQSIPVTEKQQLADFSGEINYVPSTSFRSNEMQSEPSADETPPSTDFQSEPSPKEPPSFSDFQSGPSVDKEPPPSTDFESEPTADRELPPSTNIQSNPSADEELPPSTNIQSNPSADEELPPSTNIQSDLPADKESPISAVIQPQPISDRQLLSSTEMHPSVPSSKVQSEPFTGLQSAALTNTQSPASYHENFMASTKMLTESQCEPSAHTEPASSSVMVVDAQSAPSIITQAVSSPDAQSAPAINTTFTSLTNPQTVSSSCTQPMPPRNPEPEYFENTPVPPVPITCPSATHVNTSVETKAMGSQGNQYLTSELFDEEERINAVVLEKVFAKVPDMPKTLSRRLVFKFKQYANYKNVKITPDSKVIDEFVSKISYKRSGSANQQNSKPQQGAVSNASATMSTRSGRHFPDPSLCKEKHTPASGVSKKDLPSVENIESQKVEPLQSTLLNNSISSQVQSVGAIMAEQDSVIEQPSHSTEQQHCLSKAQETANISETQASNIKPQSSFLENTNEPLTIPEYNKKPQQTSQDDTPSLSQNGPGTVDTAVQQGSLQPQLDLLSSSYSENTFTNDNSSSLQNDYIQNEKVENLQKSDQTSTLSPRTTDKCSVSKEVSAIDSTAVVNTTSKKLTKAFIESHQDVEVENPSFGDALDGTDEENNSLPQYHPISGSTEQKDSENPGNLSLPPRKHILSSDLDSEAEPDQTLVSQGHDNVCQENIAQTENKGSVQQKELDEGNEFSQIQAALGGDSFAYSKSSERVRLGSQGNEEHSTTAQDKSQDSNSKMENLPVLQGQNESTAPEEASAIPDVLETHVILPQRSIQFSGVFAKLMKQAPKSQDAKESNGTESPDGEPDRGNHTEAKASSFLDTSISSHPDSSPQSNPETTTKSQSGSRDPARSFHFSSSKLKQVLKRTLETNESSFSVSKKMKVRRASAPDMDTQIEATINRNPSPDPNSCPAPLTCSELSKEEMQYDAKGYNSSNVSYKNELQASSQGDGLTTAQNDIMESEDPALSSDQEECPIASLIAVNLAAEAEYKDSSSGSGRRVESFMEEPSHSKLGSLENNEAAQKPSSSDFNAISDKLPQSLPLVSKEKTNSTTEKPAVVDKATGRLILKVKKHNIPRFKAPKPSSTSEDSKAVVLGTEGCLSDDHFVRRSLRERKMVQTDENELTEMDELMSEDDDEYNIEEDSDAHSSDSNGSWGEGSDHSQPKRKKKAKPPPDPTAFDFKTKGKYKCWQCRKIFLKCGFAKAHMLKKHPDKGLCVVDLGQSDFLGTPQLLLFCRRKCRYATLSLEGLKNHMANCEKEVVSPLEVVKTFIDTDYEELLKLGDEVLKIPEKKVRASKKVKKSKSSEEHAESKKAEVQEDDANKCVSDWTDNAPLEHDVETSELPHSDPLDPVSQDEHPLQSTHTPAVEAPSGLYEVVDVDLECPEPLQGTKEQLPTQPSSQFHQQGVSLQQNNHHHQQQQHFHSSQSHQISNPVRPPQSLNPNSGHIPTRPRHPGLVSPCQTTAAGGIRQQVNRPSSHGPAPSIVARVGGAIRGPMPSQPSAPTQTNMYHQPNTGKRFRPNANPQQHVHIGQRATHGSSNTDFPVERPRQQVPMFANGVRGRGARLLNPRPQQAFVRAPHHQMQWQQQQPRQQSFAPQRYNSPRQPTDPQVRPRVMNPPGVRAMVGSNHKNQQQQQHWAHAGASVRGGTTISGPQQRIPAVVKNRNPGPATNQDDSYTVTESGVICLD
ncbi:RE1-silencing transcription factor [Elysia marginata]|uniref:RE1-silencing transcription factor n=1 Tax=Elysia marginata TaxID=1093978 RepID=A0AAV4FSM1_9GAST|nr:RE1-silencing transcription factor [Elysia marginata]